MVDIAENMPIRPEPAANVRKGGQFDTISKPDFVEGLSSESEAIVKHATKVFIKRSVSVSSKIRLFSSSESADFIFRPSSVEHDTIEIKQNANKEVMNSFCRRERCIRIESSGRSEGRFEGLIAKCLSERCGMRT
mmetsp:Transcript_33876/g.78227  ORF Transcript_33876/g.78227 Transcript_33876/m.78227 type:complete len:135 (-) Transcript_33876:69-473(-)